MITTTESNVLEFKVNGNDVNYKEIVASLTWLLGQAMSKEFEKVELEVTEGKEKEYIEGLAIDIFQDSDISISFK